LRRITKATLGGLAGCALVLGGTQLASGDSAVETYNYSGRLLDLQRDADGKLYTNGPLDQAQATLRIMETPWRGTGFKLKVENIDPSSVKGDVLGAHLHTGACVEGAGGQAGPHYNAGGGISPLTEVWFDVVSNANGEATFDTSVPFVPVDSLATDLGVPSSEPPVLPSPGVMSIVIHVWPTNTELNYPNDPGNVGFAGARQACLPLEVRQWNK
jgi:hypothetical protein